MKQGTWNIRLFRRKAQPSPTPLRIEGIAPAPITPEPDDAEMAAAALLEGALPSPPSREGDRAKEPHGAYEHYQALAARIRSQREEEIRAAMRYVTYCEALLDGSVAKPEGATEEEAIAAMNVGLYKYMDAAERAGGELKRRWQHCLAEATVLMMNDE